MRQDASIQGVLNLQLLRPIPDGRSEADGSDVRQLGIIVHENQLLVDEV
jgi:hypothetical protein